MKWVVAVTTAPRKECTLNSCIEHIRLAGWEPIIFAEPGSTETDCDTVHNPVKKGVWHNWLSSAKWCIENTDAEAILTMQDDTMIHPDSQAFCERRLWPAPDCGFVSLYTPKHYSYGTNRKLREPGINRVWTKGLWGACALIFPRKVLAAVINSKIANNWYGLPPRSGSAKDYNARRDNPSTIANSDTAIGKIMNTLGRSMWFVDPSAAYHAAEHSTCGHGGNVGRRNAVRIADFSKPLTLQIPRTKRYSL